MSYRTITVALEGDDDEHSVIREAVTLARALGAELVILHVNHPGAGEPHMMMDAPESITEDDLRELIRSAGLPEFAGDANIRIEEGEPYQEVLAAATETSDLLVVGHDPKHPFLAALTRGVDEAVTDIAHCPVLVVPRG